MKMIAVVLLFAGLLAASSAAPAFAYEVGVSDRLPPGNAYIPQGTVIEAELITGVNSADNDVNDIVYFKLRQNVAINGVVVLPSGTVGNAYVTSAKKAGFLGSPGKIALRVNSVQALNGAAVPLTADLKKYDAARPDMYIAYMLLGLYDAGFRKLATYTAVLHGEEREIRAGTRFSVAVDGDADLGCTPDRLAVVMVRR